MFVRRPAVALLVAPAILAGCQANPPLFDEHRVATMPDAGAVHFAVVSVAPWSSMVDELSPHFALDEESALEASVRSTQSMESAMLRLLAAAFGGRSTRDLDTPAGASAAPSTGAGPSYSAPPNPSQASPETGSKTGVPRPEDVSTTSREPDVDAMTQYWNATALLQEVRLLNSYVEHAAVRSDYRAYVVRMQITVMPRARNEPYDAYTTISFFDGGQSAPTTRDRNLDALGPTAFVDSNSAQVVPLLVTDNLEASLQYRERQTLTQLAAAIDYFREGIDTGTSVQSLTAALEQSYGKDLNSLLSVARVSDNTIRVRLGAMQQGSARFAMVPRNHNVTVLVMVPVQATGPMRAVAKTSLVDVATGIELPDRSAQSFAPEFDAIRARFEIAWSDADLRRLLALAQSNAQADFREAVKALGKRHGTASLAEYWQGLWVDLVSLALQSPYSATTFDLPSDRHTTASVTAAEPAAPFDEQHTLEFHIDARGGTPRWTVEVSPRGDVDVHTLRASVVATRGATCIAEHAAKSEPEASNGKLRFEFEPIDEALEHDDVSLTFVVSANGRRWEWPLFLRAG